MSGTEKQREARWRNHRIFRLRGAWWNCGPLDYDLQEIVRDAIDMQLTRLGVETEAERQRKRREEWEKL